jgi:hypothetical protein
MKNRVPTLFRLFHDKCLLQNTSFVKSWKQVDFTILKNIQRGVWPQVSIKASKILNLLQKEICRLSFIGADEDAMWLVELYSMKPLLRYLAINKVAVQSGKISGFDSFTIRNAKDKIILMSVSKEMQLSKLPVMRIKYVEIPTFGIKTRDLGVCSMIDRVLQTQLLLVLDPYYEAKYPDCLYSSRRGRNVFQALGFLKASLERFDSAFLRLVLISFEKCFDNILYEDVCSHFTLPFKWSPLLLRWLKSELFDKNGFFLKAVNKGLGQGLILSSLMRNVIFSKLFKKGFLDTFQFCPFDAFKTNQTKSFLPLGIKEKRVERHLLIYEDDVAFVTGNKKDIFSILTVVKHFFRKLGVVFSSGGFQVLEYFDNTPLKFEYLGFLFHYVPNRFLKRGGLLTRGDHLTKQKKRETGKGLFLTSPCAKNFQYVKSKLRKIIRLLLRKSVLEVLTQVNFVLRVFVNYYSWSNSWNRLRVLDGLVFRFFKKYLVSKFRNRGVRKPVWVAKTFFLCRTKSSISSSIFFHNHFFGCFISPHLLRWHPHVKLVDDKRVSKYSEKVLFLLLPSKALRVLPLSLATLPVNLKAQPYYLVEKEFATFSSNLYKRRINSDNYKERLFIKQKGICPFCRLALANSDLNNFTLEVHGNLLRFYSFETDASTIFKRVVLLHNNCRLEILSCFP